MLGKPHNRFDNLDALRGIAALLVVWQHSSEYIANLAPLKLPPSAIYGLAQIIDPGRIGVICFFLISGYIIPSSLKNSDTHPLKAFAVKRFFRLYPIYWASLLLALIVDACLLNRRHANGELLANITMIQKLLGEEHIQGLYWTLQIEIIFYISCAVLYATGVLRNSRAILTTCVTLIIGFLLLNFISRRDLAFSSLPKEILYTPYLLAVMFTGTAIRYWSDRKTSTEQAVALACIATTFSIPLVAGVGSIMSFNLTSDPLRFFISHTAGLTLFLIGINGRFSSPKSLIRIGVISYSIYLFHPIIMHTAGFLAATLNEYIAMPSWLGLYVAAIAVACIAFSELTYRKIEVPTSKIGQYFCIKFGLAPDGRDAKKS